jgi:hypothetical protein
LVVVPLGWEKLGWSKDQRPSMTNGGGATETCGHSSRQHALDFFSALVLWLIRLRGYMLALLYSDFFDLRSPTQGHRGFSRGQLPDFTNFNKKMSKSPQICVHSHFVHFESPLQLIGVPRPCFFNKMTPPQMSDMHLAISDIFCQYHVKIAFCTLMNIHV